ncbi:MAG: ATPase [Lentisphaerae bacterium]|nr:ATPase [Lentisphaerota bacterium]
MYLDFYGLREQPFNLTSDPSFLYLSRQHAEALDQITYGINQRKGFVEMTGEVGAGKTTVCKAMLERLDPSCSTAFVINSDLPELELLEAILDDFGLSVPHWSKIGMLRALMNFLLEEAERGRNVAVILDEAQNLVPSSLEMIRLLSNLETNKEKLFQIVLVGQPELSHKLTFPELRQIRQRISVRCRLSPLSGEEVGNYIRHRLRVAGDSGAVDFTADAIQGISDFSSGIPRLINVVCDKALLLGFVMETRTITGQHIDQCILEIEGKPSAIDAGHCRRPAGFLCKA